MKNRGFLILGSLVILVGGYAAYDYWSDHHEATLKAESSRLVKFDKDQIQDVILSRGTDKIHLQRTQEGWKITEPIQEVANQSAAGDFAESLASEKSVDMVKEGDGIDWKVFGLAAPQATLTVMNNAGEKIAFDISTQKNYIGEYYVRPVGQNKVLTVSASWNLKAKKTLLDFRDRRVLKKPSTAVVKMSVTQGKSTLHLEKKDSEWFSPDQKSWKLDQTRSNEIPFLLNNTNGLDIVKEGGVGPADLKTYNLIKPALSVQLEIREVGAWHAEFSEATKAKEVFVHTSDPDRILKVQPTDLIKFQNLTLEFLRDRHEIFDFDGTHARHLELRNLTSEGERQLKAEKKDDKWVLISSSPVAKSEALAGLLSQLKNMEISDFQTPKEMQEQAAGASKSKLVIGDDQGKTIFELHWGLSYSKNLGKGPVKLVAVQSPLHGLSWYGLEESRLQALGFSQIWPEIKVPIKPSEAGKDK